MNQLLQESLEMSTATTPPTTSPPKKHDPKIVLVFDTETSGLFPKPDEDTKITDYPYILQLSFILYDMRTQKIVHKYNKYIRVPDHVIISKFITNLTGITRQMCNCGVSIVNALLDFYRAYKLCDAVVGHNVAFDRQMIEIEVIRNYNILAQTNPMVAFMFNGIFQRLENKQQYCTMTMGRNICSIMVPSKTNPASSYKKNPKLEELYQYLFNEAMPNAHDALYDTMACLRCFVMLKAGVDPPTVMGNI